MIVDIHTHTFPDKIAKRVVDGLAGMGHVRHFTDATRPELFASIEEAGIDWAVNLPVHTRADQVVKIHRDLLACHEEMKNRHLLTFGGMHPDFEDYRTELRWLKEQGIPGIKLHPAFQQCDLDDPRMLRIVDAASELDMIVIVHGGMDVSFPDRNYASVPMILHMLKEVAPPKLIVAHMGGWGDWDRVEAELAGAPVYLDTAFSLGPVTPAPNDPVPPIRGWNMTDEAFVRLARKHGTDRVLFGTDSPWIVQKDYIARLRALPLEDSEKEQILGGNAARLLGLEA